MKINYIRFENYYGFSYVLHDVEVCCNNMMYNLKNNYINMSSYNPYEPTKEYSIGMISENKINYSRILSKIIYCPDCGKKIILNEIQDNGDIDIPPYEKERYHDYFDKNTFNNIKWKYED